MDGADRKLARLAQLRRDVDELSVEKARADADLKRTREYQERADITTALKEAVKKLGDAEAAIAYDQQELPFAEGDGV